MHWRVFLTFIKIVLGHTVNILFCRYIIQLTSFKGIDCYDDIMKINRAPPHFSEDLSNLQIGSAIILGVTLSLLCFQLRIGEDQNLRKYKWFLDTHYKFKQYLCKFYTDMLAIHKSEKVLMGPYVDPPEYIESIKAAHNCHCYK